MRRRDFLRTATAVPVLAATAAPVARAAAAAEPLLRFDPAPQLAAGQPGVAEPVFLPEAGHARARAPSR